MPIVTSKPSAEVYTSGGSCVLLTLVDTEGKEVSVCVTRSEACEYAAAIEHTVEMSARGIEHGNAMVIEP